MQLIRKFNFIPNEKLRRMRCIYATMESILEYYGCRNLVYYMGKECVFYECSPVLGIPTIWRRTKNIYDDLSSCHNFVFNKHTFNNAAEAWEHLRVNLEQNVLCQLNLDTFYLPYSSYFKSEHQRHSFCVNGIIPESSKVMIYDPGFRYYNREVDVATIEPAWAAKNFSVIDFVTPPEIIELTYSEFRKILKHNATQMLTPNMSQLYSDNTQIGLLKNYQDLKAGCDAVYALPDMIKGLLTGDNVRVRILRLSDMFGRIAEQTELHYWFLVGMANRFSRPELNVLADEMQYISQKWSIMKILLVKGMLQNKSTSFSQCADMMVRVGQLERDFFTKIENMGEC